MSDTQKCIDACNLLLRGEISAVETYDQALEKFDDFDDTLVLEEIRADHRESVIALQEHIIAMGGNPDEESGLWGTFAGAVEGTAKILGESAALKALQTGEEQDVKDYREALEDPDVMDEIKMEIRAKLLPRLEVHISALGQFVSSAS